MQRSRAHPALFLAASLLGALASGAAVADVGGQTAINKALDGRVYLNPASGSPRRSRLKDYSQSYGRAGTPEDRYFGLSVGLQLRQGAFEHAGRIDLRVQDDAVWVKQVVPLRFDSWITEHQRTQFKARVTRAITDHLDKRLEIVSVSNPRSQRRRLRLAVAFVDKAGATKEAMRVHGGSGRADAATLYLESSSTTIAHEFAHRLLNAPDEYIDAESLALAPGRNPRARRFSKVLGHDPGSLMRNHRTGTLLPFHALTVARLVGRLLSSHQAVALAPEHRFLSDTTKLRQGVERCWEAIRASRAGTGTYWDYCWTPLINQLTRMNPDLAREIQTNDIYAPNGIPALRLIAGRYGFE